MSKKLKTSKPIAPEDVRPRDYVAVLHVLGEHLLVGCDEAAWRKPEPVRIHWLPMSGGMPMKVVDVCLPFILVERPGGKHRTIDLRRFRLGKVSKRYGRKVFENARETTLGFFGPADLI